jgi:hypothetical protein
MQQVYGFKCTLKSMQIKFSRVTRNATVRRKLVAY